MSEEAPAEGAPAAEEGGKEGGEEGGEEGGGEGDDAQTPELPTQEILDKIQEQLQSLPDKINDKAKDIDEARQGVPKYDVKSSKSGKVLTTIKADDSMVRINEIAALLVLEDDIASDVAEAVWEAVSPQIEQLKPSSMPDFIWTRVEKKLHGKFVGMVSSAVKKAMEAALTSKGCKNVEVT